MRYKVPDSVRIGDCLLLLILITICVYDKIIVQTTWQTDLSLRRCEMVFAKRNHH